MLKPFHIDRLLGCLLLTALFCFSPLCFASDPLPSWNDGPVKQSIIHFVQKVTDQSSKEYVPPEKRIAAFDNDGTLIVEQPYYSEGQFSFERLDELSKAHPEWKTEAPYELIVNHDRNLMKKMTKKDLALIIAVTHAGMPMDDYMAVVKHWLATARQPKFQQVYTELVYLPMLEVMKYLRDNQFSIYIVTAGGQDFVRAYSQPVYGVNVDHVIGTALRTKYTYEKNGEPELIKMPAIWVMDNEEGKPEAIQLMVGQKPIIAFGNSDGDQQMLEWTQSNKGPSLMLLVHHDDAKREYAYDTQSFVGHFPLKLMTEAKLRGWKIISMKEDWKQIFPREIS